MTEFERDVYTGMRSPERVLVWMMKALEMKELMDLMTEHDFELLREFFKGKEKVGKKRRHR